MISIFSTMVIAAASLVIMGIGAVIVIALLILLEVNRARAVNSFTPKPQAAPEPTVDVDIDQFICGEVAKLTVPDQPLTVFDKRGRASEKTLVQAATDAVRDQFAGQAVTQQTLTHMGAVIQRTVPLLMWRSAVGQLLVDPRRLSGLAQLPEYAAVKDQLPTEAQAHALAAALTK
ncbi:hypothetical protein [Lacticaseibacillus mingshuiensis]|uniref:Uncharacterized protein n=1 Tax=Lacticaseibacillus mingshuiensis TaxID=2799574 RepID=A0ABW4CH91_9LACO|nr:hypothetical protein [Lacticaseibacillus mingshuiensis]